MDLVYIYGPPAAGKYTVGVELAAMTGYKLFHNHLSIAPIEAVFEFGTPAFWDLVHGIREAVISAAARDGVSLIFTNVYAHPGDLQQARRRFELTEAHGGRVCLVRLTCSQDVIERRLESEHRRSMRKLSEVEAFRRSIEGKDVFSAIPGRESLVVDTVHLSPQEAAMRIIRHHKLPERGA